MRKLTFILLAAVFLSGCAKSQVLVRPYSGETIRCWYYGTQLLPYLSYQQCIKDAESLGYVKLEELATTGIYGPSDPTKPLTILRIDPGSPAALAGLKVGDRIIERDGVKINTAGDFQSMPLIRIGQQVVYKILRDGQQIIVTLKAVPIKVVHPTF
ncbi:MAG: PDZ domain-containing protein [Deltaproteobacteria bacterium]|nr:PDZ domain-containing protein [Deltaproteobacteria bacterium]